MTTEIVLISVVVGLIGYDIYAVIKGGFSNTISWFIYTVAQKYPIIPFGFGVLIGHFFWSQVC